MRRPQINQVLYWIVQLNCLGRASMPVTTWKQFRKLEHSYWNAWAEILAFKEMMVLGGKDYGSWLDPKNGPLKHAPFKQCSYKKRPRGTSWSTCHTGQRRWGLLTNSVDFLFPTTMRNKLLLGKCYQAFWNLVRATQSIFKRVTCPSWELVKNRKPQATVWSRWTGICLWSSSVCSPQAPSSFENSARCLSGTVGLPVH